MSGVTIGIAVAIAAVAVLVAASAIILFVKPVREKVFRMRNREKHLSAEV